MQTNKTVPEKILNSSHISIDQLCPMIYFNQTWLKVLSVQIFKNFYLINIFIIFQLVVDKSSDFVCIDKMHLINEDEEDICSVCCTNISRWSDDGTKAVALNRCGHWFCISCWQIHLVELVNRRSLAFQCPAYNCDNIVDDVTLFSLLPFQYIEQHKRFIVDSEINRRSNRWSWCINSKCQRIAYISDGQIESSNQKNRYFHILSYRMNGGSIFRDI